MKELFEFAFEPANLFYTVLLILVLLYWLSVFIGAMDIGAFDVDLDMDVDVDVDMDIDVDSEVEVSSSGGNWFLEGLRFFNFGVLPFMVIMSFLILFMWTINILANYYWSNGSILFHLAMFFPSLLASLFLTKIITTPLTGLFRALRDGDAKDIEYIGSVAKLTLPLDRSRTATADLVLKDQHILLYVRADDSVEGVIPRGTKVLITSSNAEKTIHFVRPLDY